MPLEPYLNTPDHIRQLLLSRRGMLHAGLLPLLALRGSAGQLIQSGDPNSAMALELEGTETGMLPLAISPDGASAYLTMAERDVVLVVDLRAGRVRSGIDLTPAGPFSQWDQAVLSADGRLLFVVNHGIGGVAVIDTTTERVVKALPFRAGFSDPIKASPAGKVYIALEDGRLVTVSCADLSYTTTSFGVQLDSIALSPQRANLLYAVSFRNDENYFHAYNLETGREERRAALPKAACRPSGGVSRLLLSPSGDVAYLGWNLPVNGCGTGNLTAFDLGTFQPRATTPIEDGVSDFAVHPENGKVYAVGSYEGPQQGRVNLRMYISEWDPASQKVTRRLPISPSDLVSSIHIDPLNPRFVYSTEVRQGVIRKVDTLSGTEYMRVRFFSGKRLPYAATSSGSLGYITCHRSPLVHRLDLNTGKLAGTLDLPGMSGSGVCAYHDGKLYLGEYSNFSVINAADGALILSREAPDRLFLNKPLQFFGDKIAAVAGPRGGDPDRIVILDARTWDVVNSFSFELQVLAASACVVVSPEGTKLYVQEGLGYGRAILKVLDSATLRVLKRFELPATRLQGGVGSSCGTFDEQARIAYLAGFISVYKVHMDTDEYLGTLDFFDVYKEMGRAAGEGWPLSAPSGVYLSPARDRLFIASWDGSTVIQYDLRNQKWIPRVVPVGLGPGATMISPDRKYMYTVSYRSDTITRLDTTTGNVVDVTPLGGPVSALNTYSLSHAASYQNVGVVPGCAMVIRDAGSLPGVIGPPFLTLPELDGSGKVATEIGETKVLFDGVPAPLLHAYAAQVSVMVPYSVAGKRTVKMQLVYKGEETHPVEFNVRDAMPGIFTMDATGQGQAVMLNENYSLNGPASPAAKGSWVMFYFSGAGQTDPPGVDGEVTSTVLARPRLPVYVWIAGREVEVLYAGAAPGIVSGVMQVNVRLPMDIASGDNLPIAMKVGSWGPSPDGVTMAIR